MKVLIKHSGFQKWIDALPVELAWDHYGNQKREGQCWNWFLSNLRFPELQGPFVYQHKLVLCLTSVFVQLEKSANPHLGMWCSAMSQKIPYSQPHLDYNGCPITTWGNNLETPGDRRHHLLDKGLKIHINITTSNSYLLAWSKNSGYLFGKNGGEEGLGNAQEDLE